MQKIQYFETEERTQKSMQKFGKLKLILNTKWMVITVGPDYRFFILAFFLFLICGIFIITIVNDTIKNWFFCWLTNFICVFQPLTFLYTALSNPGIVNKSLIDLESQTITSIELTNKEYRLCKKCNIVTKHSTQHCRQCEVCVEEYDHHCSWVSKCIGKNNLTAFHFFISITPIFILYSIIMLFACAGISIINSKNGN